MRARIPYLAGLAGQHAGRPPLRPPRRAFANDADVYTPILSPERRASPRRQTGDAAGRRVPRALPGSDVADEPPVSLEVPSSRAQKTSVGGTGWDPAGGAAPAPAIPAAAAPDMPAAPVETVPAPPVLTAGASTVAKDATVVAPAAGGAQQTGGPTAPAEPANVAPRRAPSLSTAPVAPPEAAHVVTPTSAAQVAAQPPVAATPHARPAATAPVADAVQVAPRTPSDQGAARPPPAAQPPGLRAEPDRTDQARVIPQWPMASSAGSPAATDTSRPTLNNPGAQPFSPSLSDRRDAAGDAAQSRPVVPTAGVPQWGMPVELPAAVDPVFGAPARPHADQTAASLPDRLAAVAEPPPHRATRAVRELLPPPAPAARATEQPGLRPGGPPHDKGAAEGARLSIGTIEVTVLPPPQPAPPSSDVPPHVPALPGRSRSGTIFAASPGSDRLRAGLRRWYGTAQG
jgi:hypothetical protein